MDGITTKEPFKLPAINFLPVIYFHKTFMVAGKSVNKKTMGEATNELRNRIVLIFDFDGTLAPNTVDFFLQSHGVDPDQFKKEKVEPLIKKGWDSQLANFYAFLETVNQLNLKKESFKKLGEKFEPFEGVLQMFDKIHDKAKEIVPDIEVNFFLVTCGFLDLLRPMKIFKKFKRAWGCELFFNEDGKAVFVKKAVSHPDKVRFILQIAKGFKDAELDSPSDVYKEIPEEDWFVPLDQVIYVGDGKSDMPAFSLMLEHNGIAIGVVDAEKVEQWDGYKAMHANRKVENLAIADYTDESELMQSLLLAVESISHKVKLRKLSKGE